MGFQLTKIEIDNIVSCKRYAIENALLKCQRLFTQFGKVEEIRKQRAHEEKKKKQMVPSNAPAMATSNTEPSEHKDGYELLVYWGSHMNTFLGMFYSNQCTKMFKNYYMKKIESFNI